MDKGKDRRGWERWTQPRKRAEVLGDLGQLLFRGRLTPVSYGFLRTSPLSPQVSSGSSPKTLGSKCTVRVCESCQPVALFGFTPVGR